MFGNNIIGPLGRSSLSLPKILNGLSKTLGVVNQAIPLYKQAKPMIQKGRTLFKLASEINKPTTTTKSQNKVNNSLKIPNPIKKTNSLNKPVFFQ